MNTEVYTERAGKDRGVVASERANYAGIVFPRYLITRTTFEEKMAKIRKIISQSKSKLAEGVSNVNAGDTHGQYHNELAWYREQEISAANRRAADLGEGLDQACIIEDYDEVRDRVKKVLNTPQIDIATLGTRVKVAYGEDSDDVEEILLVAPLDGGSKPGWVSVNAPLARAIEGKKIGEKCFMGDKKNQIALKILTIE